MTDKETIKLYLVVNKLIYAHSVLGEKIFVTSGNTSTDSDDFKKLFELSVAIDMLTESGQNLLLEGKDYPFYGVLEGIELDKLLDSLIYNYNLDPVPYLDFPKNSTKYIASSVNLSVSGEGTALPEGGGVDFFLTKNLSGQLVWKEIDVLKSDFNLI